MEKAKVYFSDLRTSPTSNLLDKMERLLKRAGIGQLPLQDSFTAIKIHLIWHTSAPTMQRVWPIYSAVSEPNLS